MRFFRWIRKLFSEDLVSVEHGNFFVTKFDPETQRFRNVIWDEDLKKFRFE